MDKIQAKHRLSDFDFSGDDCHEALVDEAANAHDILVMKAVINTEAQIMPEQPQAAPKRVQQS